MEMERNNKRLVAIVLAAIALVTGIILISVLVNNGNDNNDSMSDSSLSESLSSEFSSELSNSEVDPSTDESYIESLNTHLRDYETKNGRIDYFSEVVEVLNEKNISLDSLKSNNSNHHFLWNSTTNSFVLIDNNDKVIYPSNLTISHKANLYKVINNEEDVKNFEGYSMYVSNVFDKDTINIKKMSNIEVAKKNLKININDVNATGSYIVLGELEKVFVHLDKATITLFKSIKNVEVSTNSSIDIYGNVDYIKLNSGTINALTGSKINTIDATQSTNNSKVTKNDSSEISKIISNNENICDDKSIIVKP